MLAKGPGMDEGGLTLQRLHQIGMKRVLHQHGHRAADPQIVEGDRSAVLGQSHDDPAHPLPQVAQRRRVVGAIGKGEYGHELAGDRDVVPALPGTTVDRPTQTDHHVAKRPVVDIDDPTPADPVGVDVETLQPERMEGLVGEATLVVPAGVDGRRHQIVRHRDGVHVAGEMEVELVHRDDLAVPTTGRAALDPECGAHARLSDAGDRPVAQAPRPWTRPMVVVVFPSPSGVGVIAVTSTYLPDGVADDPAKGIEMDLRLGGAVGDDLFLFETEVPRHFADRLEFGGAGDLEITRHRWQRLGHAVVLACDAERGRDQTERAAPLDPGNLDQQHCPPSRL